jgi:DNA-binding Lrp family transcriptional regulator
MGNDTLLDMLSKSEQKVLQYIQESCNDNNGSIKISMDKMGEAIGVSEATVHRAVRKLKSNGVIGIVPSEEKQEPNEIVYYGETDAEEDVDDIFQLYSKLSSSVNKFQNSLAVKNREILQLSAANKELDEKLTSITNELTQKDELIKNLQNTITQYEKGNPIFAESKIINIVELEDGTTALIFK